MIGGRMLGDLEADELKIDSPGGGPFRIAPLYEDIPDPGQYVEYMVYGASIWGRPLEGTCQENKIIPW